MGAVDDHGRIFSVSELTAEIKALLEKKFSFIWLRAEISNLRVPASGHCYFTLKDADAQIRAVMFRGQNQRLTFKPRNGMRVTGLGRISLYVPRGEYQIILEHLEPDGLGALQAAFEQLRDKLSQEGLFDEKHKQALPFLPQTIALITSTTGSVLYDILHVLTRRFPDLAIEIVPVAVQGDAAPEQIVSGINLLNSRATADVIILARGGGSLEDLWAFNTEPVARSIFASKIPVISAIGHETDFTISDWVADVRAPTPSAAAEIVVPQKHDLMQRCDELRQMLLNGMQRHLFVQRNTLESIKKRLISPEHQTQIQKEYMVQIQKRLARHMTHLLQRKQDTIKINMTFLKTNKTIRQISEIKAKVDTCNRNLLKMKRQCLNGYETRLEQLTKQLQALNPAAVLKRGYSITREHPGGKIVKHADAVKLGQRLEIILSRGTLKVETRSKTAENPLNSEEIH